MNCRTLRRLSWLFCFVFWFGTSAAALSAVNASPADSLQKDLNYYKTLNRKKGLSLNDRLYVLQTIYLKYAESGLDLTRVESEISRLKEGQTPRSSKTVIAPISRSRAPARGSRKKKSEPTISIVVVNEISVDDEDALSALGSEVLSDPANPKPRQLLESLVQERLIYKYEKIQNYRAEALSLGLEVCRRAGGPSNMENRLVKALDDIRREVPASFLWSGDVSVPESEGAKEKLFWKMLSQSNGYSKRGRLEEAVVLLVRALGLRPGDPDGLAALENLLKSKTTPAGLPGSDAIVGSEVRAAEPASETPSRRTEIAQELFREGIRSYGRGEFEGAVASFQESLRWDPDNEWVKRSLARTKAEVKEKRPPAELWED